MTSLFFSQVVSLYEYKANRSDELTIRRGDVIHVLFKDKENDAWWFGRLASGLQGYFPASYVIDQSKYIMFLSPTAKRWLIFSLLMIHLLRL